MQVVLLSHSWGDTVSRYFLTWISATYPDWVEHHLAAYTNVAGATLGALKSVPFLLSGINLTSS